MVMSRKTSLALFFTAGLPLLAGIVIRLNGRLNGEAAGISAVVGLCAASAYLAGYAAGRFITGDGGNAG